MVVGWTIVGGLPRGGVSWREVDIKGPRVPRFTLRAIRLRWFLDFVAVDPWPGGTVGVSQTLRIGQ